MTEEEEILEKAQKMAGNWDRDGFCWWKSNQPPDPYNWTMTEPEHRDSTLTEQSNAAQIIEVLRPYEKCGDVHIGQNSCDIVGWRTVIFVRVLGTDGKPTEAFRELCDLNTQIEEYGFLNDDDYSRREYLAALSWIVQEGEKFVKEPRPKDWPEYVFDTLWEDPDTRGELENENDIGATPSDKAIKNALIILGILKEEDDEESD